VEGQSGATAPDVDGLSNLVFDPRPAEFFHHIVEYYETEGKTVPGGDGLSGDGGIWFARRLFGLRMARFVRDFPVDELPRAL
jgi:hypothetical protein